MKTSVILICMLLINSAILLGDPLSVIADSINTWLLIMVEVILLIGLYINNILKGLKKDLVFDLNNLNVFTFQSSLKKEKSRSGSSSLLQDDLD
ncbi:MAG: hypothetical protein KJO63_10280, partial [Maribacter sp.]|nr:hypothetical protein [Maribacter sp.]